MQIPRVPWDCKIYYEWVWYGRKSLSELFWFCFLVVLDFAGLSLFIWDFYLGNWLEVGRSD